MPPIYNGKNEINQVTIDNVVINQKLYGDIYCNNTWVVEKTDACGNIISTSSKCN